MLMFCLDIYLYYCYYPAAIPLFLSVFPTLCIPLLNIVLYYDALGVLVTDVCCFLRDLLSDPVAVCAT